MINDREFGATEAVRLEKDKLQIADMDYVVKAFLEYLYREDQRTRSKDIEAALRLMVVSAPCGADGPNASSASPGSNSVAPSLTWARGA